MPPQLLFDISGIDLNRVLVDQAGIRQVNPQRGAMEHLSGIVWYNTTGRIIGFKDVRDDEFWVEGHIPGRPLLPGVIMIEAAAQMASFYVKSALKWEGFVGFGGVEDCKFRVPVAPGCRMYLFCQQTGARHRRFTSKIQGLVNGQLVFEATITGAVM